ncbi:MAG: HDOD domain-containing protein [Oscillospiraceae bacterium]|nr:HDOD domain-containing protein [Oscillospiraceae bacterium]
MDIMVVPKPIFNASKTVKGYYLSFQLGNALLEEGRPVSLEDNVHSPFFAFVNQIGLATLTLGLPIFVPVTNVQLATDLERICEVERTNVVLLMGKKIDLSEANLQRIARFKELGFQAAFIHRTDIAAMEPFYPYIDYIFSGNDTPEVMSLAGSVRRSRQPVKVIAKNVSDDTTFERMKAYGLEYFEGCFYVEAVKRVKTQVSPLKVNYIRLLDQVSQEDFELDQFARIIQEDVALAMQFLKMVNTSSVRSGEITSLRHAAAMLGQKEVKKWATTAVTITLGQEGPNEIVRLSMLRAKFCENLAGLFELGVHRENLFLMGLFSVLDVVMERPMKDALALVHVPDTVRAALMGQPSVLNEVYQFTRLYELADWSEISRIALIRNMPINRIFQAYNDALVWYGELVMAPAADLREP